MENQGQQQEQWRHLMGELGSMTSGYPNQPGEYCETPHPYVPEPQSQIVYPPFTTQDYTFPSQAMNAQWAPQYYGNQIIPHLVIVEGPIGKIRFRYQSERGSHGSMAGRNSNTTQKSWPTVKLENYTGDVNGLKIRASLYTEDKMKLHVHKLLGKNCTDTGECLLPLNNTDMTCCFPSLGVLFTEKKRVPDVLLDRKLKSLEAYTEEDKLQLSEEAKMEAKDMKLNSVRICFQAVGSNNEPITEPVFSEPVHNLKSPDSGELKITRLSRFSSRCEGGDEIFLLCEKVNKKDIKVRFYHQEEERLIWEAYGKFTDADVHHQVAIVFKTPPYMDCNIDKPVKVYVQLFRKNDGETSDSVEFTYKPRDRDPEFIQHKKRRLSDPDHDHKDYGSMDPSFMGHQNQYGPAGSGHASWSDGSSQGAYSFMPQQHGGHNYQGNQMASFVSEFAQGLAMEQPSPSTSSLSTQSETPSPEPVTPGEAEVVSTTLESLDRFIHSDATQNVLDPTVSPIQFVENESTNSIPFNNDPLFDLDSAQKTRTISMPSPSDSLQTKMSELKLSDPDQNAKTAKKPSVRSKKDPTDKRSKPRPKSKSFTLGVEHPKVQAAERSRRGTEPAPPKSRRSTGSRLDSRSRPMIEHFIRTHWVPRFGRALRAFTTTGRVQSLLWPMAPFVACQNEDGDNAVHLAVIHQSGNNPLFQELMPIVSSHMACNVVNHTNNLYQTPLHLAVEVEEVNVIKWLLVSGADPNFQDRRGNTPIHLAVTKNNTSCLTILLDKANYRIHSPDQPLPDCNILNYEGYSALHLCVFLGSFSCLSLLLDADAQVNIQVGTSGRTALHLAVEMQSPLVEELLKQQSLEVDAQDYAGNTALHIACSMELYETAYALVKADANPLAENFVFSVEDDVEEEEEEEEGVKGQTPAAMCSGNVKLSSILNDTLSLEDVKTFDLARRRSRETIVAENPVPKPSEPSPASPGDRPGTSDFISDQKQSQTMSDVGYETGPGTSSSGPLSTFESSKEKLWNGLCKILDPPSKGWEKLASIVFEDKKMIEQIRKLETSPTETLLETIEKKGGSLSFMLEAASLSDACVYLQEFDEKL